MTIKELLKETVNVNDINTQIAKYTVGVKEKQTQYGSGKMEKWRVFSTVQRIRVESRG